MVPFLKNRRRASRLHEPESDLIRGALQVEDDRLHFLWGRESNRLGRTLRKRFQLDMERFTLPLESGKDSRTGISADPSPALS